MNKAEIQEQEYDFPYHYIPTYQNGEFSQSRDLWWGYEYLSFLTFVLEQIKGRGTSVVDIGCGDGRLLWELKKNHTGRLVGIDYSERSLAFARAFNPELTFWQLDMMKGELPEHNAFDIATAVEVLEHIKPKKLDTLVKNASQLLKKDGVFLLTVPSTNEPQAPKHHQHFTAESLKKILQPSFRVEEVVYLNKRSAGQKFLQRLLINRFFSLRHGRLGGILYRLYVSRFRLTNPHNAKRIFVRCTKSQ